MNEITLSEFAAEMAHGARAILLVRHAERPRMDPDDPSFGDALPITEEGVRTSTKLGEALAGFRDSVQFHSSPLLRTRMTAAAIASGMGVPDAPVPTDGRLGNDSFYYADVAEVLEAFRPERFFDTCFEYFRRGEMRGFANLAAATDEWERWLFERFEKRLFVVTTHDCYIAAFLSARGAGVFSRENWPRFLDAGAILVGPDGSRRHVLVRTGLSSGICGVGGKVL